MKFKKIEINNFRNFEQIHIDLENKNVLFGLNDIGKTNFLYALRFLFDRDCRKNGLIETDFYKKDITREIEITVTRQEERLLVLCNCMSQYGKEYCKRIKNNVEEMNKIGVKIKLQEVAYCTNSVEYS